MPWAELEEVKRAGTTMEGGHSKIGVGQNNKCAATDQSIKGDPSRVTVKLAVWE